MSGGSRYLNIIVKINQVLKNKTKSKKTNKQKKKTPKHGWILLWPVNEENFLISLEIIWKKIDKMNILKIKTLKQFLCVNAAAAAKSL